VAVVDLQIATDTNTAISCNNYQNDVAYCI